MNEYYSNQKLSVIIPTLNEADNIKELVSRLVTTLTPCTKEYELIFIDDASSDKTVYEINKLTARLPVSVHPKSGEKGKSFSLIEGFNLAKYELLAMIDADLQYPPEALKQMLGKIIDEQADIVLAHRHKHYEGYIRKFGSKINGYINKHLFGFNYDVQAGLKLFKKETFKKMNFKKVGPWTFDMLFIFQARQLNYKVSMVDINFDKRIHGKSKVNFIKVGFEILAFAIKLKLGYFLETKIKLLNKLWVRQFIKFSMIGVLNTLIDVGIYFILIRSIHFFLVNFILAKAISYIIASINSFIFNRRYTFKSHNTSWLYILPFMSVGAIGLIINVSILDLLVRVAGLNQLYSVIIATLAVLSYNFLFSKFYIFSNSKKK